MEEKLSRQQLYDLVWSEPLTKIAKRFDITDVGLRKICIRMGIPLPKAGHWQKVRSGNSVQIRTLSSSFIGEIEVTLRLRPEGSNHTTASLLPLYNQQQDVVKDVSELLIVPES